MTRKRFPTYLPKPSRPLLFFLFLIIALSNDTESNPGPSNGSTKYICGRGPTCDNTVTWEHKGIVCETFDQWYHIDCQNVHSNTTTNYMIVWYIGIASVTIPTIVRVHAIYTVLLVYDPTHLKVFINTRIWIMKITLNHLPTYLSHRINRIQNKPQNQRSKVKPHYEYLTSTSSQLNVNNILSKHYWKY